MAEVGTKELKNRLSHYLRLVRKGARFVITDHGRPVAELGPVRSAEDEQEQVWLGLAAKGLVTLPTRKGFADFEPLRLKDGVKVSDIIIEDRG